MDGADTSGGVFRPGDNLPLGRKTHKTAPSAGRTGSVLTCLINFLFTNENGVCYTSKTVPLMQYDMERRAASPRDRE